LEESSEFDEDRLDLNKWEGMVEPRQKIDTKREYAMRRMKSSTLLRFTTAVLGFRKEKWD
jgi:hypothetical protein